MAKQLPCSAAWTDNRHDRKRGTQPPDCICRNRECGANLHDVGVYMLEGYGYLCGRYQVGVEDGGVVIEVLRYTNHHAEVQCCECDSGQPQLHFERAEYDPEALSEDEAFELDNPTDPDEDEDAR